MCFSLSSESWLCNRLGEVMRVFVTFADESWRRAMKRILREAEALQFYDQLHGFNETMLEQSFKARHTKYLVRGTRGFGYWCWKPQIILQAMEQLNEGDVLQYTDAGCHLNPAGRWRLTEYFDIAFHSRDGVVAFQAKPPSPPLPALPCEPLDLRDYRWAKGDLVDYLEVRENPCILETQTIGAGIIFVRKCRSGIELIKEWASVIEAGFYLIDDTPSKSPNLPGFQEHRHDQAIFSLLCKKRGIETLSAYEYWYPSRNGITPDWAALRNYPIHVKRDNGFMKRSKLKIGRLARRLRGRRV